MTTDFDKHIWEGWTVRDFIEELLPTIKLIMDNQSYIKAFKTKKEIQDWCTDNQPYYKKPIPEVSNYFINLYNITK